MARVRNTKLRAQRIELDYFKRRHWLRSGRSWLGLAALVASGASVGFLVASGDHNAASPGPVASGHALIAERCDTCHSRGEGSSTLFLAATDDACRGCHLVGDHRARIKDTTACTTCHTEHRGSAVLAHVPAAECTACHANLDAAAEGTPGVVGSDASRVRSLADGHPEFAVWISRGPKSTRVRLDATPPPSDPSHLQFSHAKHLSPDLRGPAGQKTVQLVCGDCHQAPLATATTRFGRTPPPAGPPSAIDVAPAEEAIYFAPVRYESHCIGCHPHTFDQRIDAAPHDTPYVVRRFLQGAYARYALDHPDVIAGTPRRRPIAGGAEATSSPSPEEWARAQVVDAEHLLFRQPCPENEPCPRCQQCHTIDDAAGTEAPTVVPPDLPLRWLPQSRFDHSAHRLLKCAECHGDVAKSAKATDILLPRVDTCRSCHHPDGASDRCAECHTYHAATGPRELDGPKTIRDLSGSR